MDAQKKDEIYLRLSRQYADAHCELNYTTPFELLVAVILSAQCTDKRVNIVTKQLFLEANTPCAFAAMQPERLEQLIFSCGFYRNKARNIICAARDIEERFGGKVPSQMSDLISLKGVGRKTANVVLNTIFNKSTVAVDTHVFRVSQRLCLSAAKTPQGVEKDLDTLFSEEQKQNLHHLLIFHGRYCCHSQKPNCKQCCLVDICGQNNKAIECK